jgi:hypothetical protein
LPKDEEKFRTRNDWVVITGSRSILDAIPTIRPQPDRHDDFENPVWTDQNNNQFRILIGMR